jgi:hypothetical protein
MTRYQVTVEGVTVIRNTPDFVSSIGDKGDNIYINVETIFVNPALRPQYFHISNTSQIYGELRDSSGDYYTGKTLYAGKKGKGLIDGDEIPYPQPWIRNSGLHKDELPMIVGEDTSTEYSGMIIFPSIWKWNKKKDLYSKLIQR